MFSLETLIMISAIVFCIGGLVGAVISRTLLPPEMQKDLEKQLQSSREELDRYQQDVAQHFAETSQLVSNLTESYKEVHNHLARGAVQLTNSEISKKVLEAGDDTIGMEAQNAIEDLNFEPPKDYAPKTPGQKGILSEEFGLHEENHTELDDSDSVSEPIMQTK